MYFSAYMSHNVMMCYVGKCDDPSTLIHNNVTVSGYEDPALEGENITLTCATGAILSGPNSSICARNGEWEPDPRAVECTHEHDLTTGTTMPGMYATKFSVSHRTWTR